MNGCRWDTVQETGHQSTGNFRLLLVYYQPVGNGFLEAAVVEDTALKTVILLFLC